MDYAWNLHFSWNTDFAFNMDYVWNIDEIWIFLNIKNEGRDDFSIEIGNIKEKEILWVSDTWDCYKWIELMMHILF